jgi:hypothetical protein
MFPFIVQQARGKPRAGLKGMARLSSFLEYAGISFIDGCPHASEFGSQSIAVVTHEV